MPVLQGSVLRSGVTNARQSHMHAVSVHCAFVNAYTPNKYVFCAGHNGTIVTINPGVTSACAFCSL